MLVVPFFYVDDCFPPSFPPPPVPLVFFSPVRRGFREGSNLVFSMKAPLFSLSTELSSLLRISGRGASLKESRLLFALCWDVPAMCLEKSAVEIRGVPHEAALAPSLFFGRFVEDECFFLLRGRKPLSFFFLFKGARLFSPLFLP